MKNIIIWSAFCLVSIFSSAQGTSYGFTYGQGIEETSKFSIALDYNYYFNINDDFYLGIAASGINRNFSFSNENSSDSEVSLLFGDIGIGARYYLNETFKVNLDAGYSVLISSADIDEDGIGGFIFIKPYLELDLDSFSIIAGPSFALGNNINFTSINLGLRFTDIY